jgi:cytochrome oxidase Cu insertion factor (SCO1/SenC/PrrC family)
MTHPELGRLRINCDILTVPDDDQQVVFMTADPDTPTARALRHLATQVS